MKSQINQSELIMEYFKSNPNRDIAHPEIVDWVVEEYKKKELAMFLETPIEALES